MTGLKHVAALLSISAITIVDVCAQYGVPDPSFGEDGFALSQTWGWPVDVLPLPDGKYLLVNGSAMFRGMPDGSPDTTFADSGLVVNTALFDIVVNKALLMPDGKVLQVGYHSLPPSDGELAVVRHHPDGSLDPTFGTGGIAYHNEGPDEVLIHDAALQSDGKIIVCGFTGSYGTSMTRTLARVRPDGSLDTDFGTNGWVIAGRGSFLGVALAADGDIIAVGGDRDVDSDTLIVARFDANGVPDQAFGNNGLVLTDRLTGTNGMGREVALDVVVQDNGDIVLCGDIHLGNHVFWERYHAEGAPDPSFGDDGRITDASPVVGLSDLLIQPDGAILCAGAFSTDGMEFNIALVRLTSSGAYDPTFGAGGVVNVSASPEQDHVTGMALQSDGRILICGTWGMQWMTARFLSGLPAAIAERAGAPSALRAYPVPARDELVIQWPFSGAAPGQLEFLDVSGRSLRTLTILPNAGLCKVRIPDTWAEGVYTIRLQQGQRTAVGRMIVE